MLTDDGPDPRLLVDGLAARGFNAVSRRLHGFPLNPLAAHGTFYAGFDVLRAIAVLLFDRRVDVIVSIGESNLVVILLLGRWLRFRPRIVLREISARGWARRDRVVDFVLPRVDRVMVLTSHQRNWAAAHARLKVAADIVGFAIDERFWRPQGSADGGYILAVGDDASRDYACLIAACEALPYRLILRTGMAPALPVAMRERVTILGRQSFRALRALYDAAAIVVVPLGRIDHPGGITALFEAMAMGRAVVATEAGSTRDAVRDGENGVLVPPGDADAMRAALAALMADAPARARLGASARRTIEGPLSYAAYVDRFAASLDAATSGDGAVP